MLRTRKQRERLGSPSYYSKAEEKKRLKEEKEEEEKDRENEERERRREKVTRQMREEEEARRAKMSYSDRVAEVNARIRVDYIADCALQREEDQWYEYAERILRDGIQEMDNEKY